MVLLTSSLRTITAFLAIALLSSAALQSTRIPLPDEFEPYRLHISADSAPDFVSSRANPYETLRDFTASENNDEEDERLIAATLNLDITEIKTYTGHNLGAELGNPPFTVVEPDLAWESSSRSSSRRRVVHRTAKVVIAMYSFDPPMDVVDLKVDGGPRGLLRTDCFIITSVDGLYVRFGMGVWEGARDVVGVYCSGYFPMGVEEEEEEEEMM